MFRLGKNEICEDIEILSNIRAKYRIGLNELEDLEEALKKHNADGFNDADIVTLKIALDGINEAIKGLYEALDRVDA